MAYMLCKNPFVSTAGRVFGCGQCMPCRFNKRRIWSHRIMLEAGQYEDNTFVTLSYDDEHLPLDGSVCPRDLQLWLKRLRKTLADAREFDDENGQPRRIRFFAVGEYGDNSFRPHYHAALFNFPNCNYGQSQYSSRRSRCCAWCNLVADTWKKGNVYLGTLEPSSAGYISGYVTKKMTGAGDARLQGRYPEFARMSLRPGIGGDAMHELADVVLQYNLDKEDVPSALRHGSKEKPLGRYLVRRLRVLTGHEANAPQIIVDKIDKELLPLREAARASEENPSLKARVVEANLGKVQRFEAKERIFRKRRVL